MPKDLSMRTEGGKQVASRRSKGADLPPPDTRRWVPRRKAQVVAAVELGVLTAEDACRRYDLTLEELESWKQLYRRHGRKGLRVTHLHRYRERPLRRRAGAPTGSSKVISVIGGGPGLF